MNRTAVWGRRFAALTLLLALAGTDASPGFGAARAPHPDSDLLAQLRATETTDHDALLVGANVSMGMERPTQVSLPITAFAMGADAGRPVTVREIRVAGPDGRTRAEVRPEQRLRAVSDIAASRTEVLARLADPDPAHSKAVFERGPAVRPITVPVGDLALADGTTTTFTVTATFDVAGIERTATLPLTVSIAALPAQPFWNAGDGHLHTTWSDGWNSMDTQVSSAKNSGHKWILVTDHWKGIWAEGNRGDANWALYRNDCSAKEAVYQLPVLPGVELMAAANKGHALAYNLAGTRVPPRDEYFSAADLVTAINGHTPGASYAVVAHPYSATADRWGDWSASGFRTIELMSQERQASASTQSKWFELLRAGLASRIAGGPFVVGVANSDAHVTWQRPGEMGVSWIRSTATPLTRSAVWTAIAAGTVSASGREDLGFFTVNGVQQGGVVAASSTTTLTFGVTQRPVTGRKCTEISIRNSANGVAWSIANPTAATYTKSLPAPAADTFYVVKMVFAKTSDTDYSHVWCNPVFVDRR